MARFQFDIGIIGGGAAGLTVASGAAQLGAKTLLVEKEPALGGDCLHFGCVPSKTLIKSAHVYHLMAQGPRFGLPAIEVPPVDFSKVAQRIREVIGVIQKHDSVERFNSLGVQVEFGSPGFVDEHTISIGANRFDARCWVIATGSEAAVPPVPGLDAVPYLTNREIFSLDTLPQSLVVLGAGPIAMEMAQSFSRLGSKVSVVQRSGQILSKEDRDMADIVMERIQEEGVRFFLNVQVQEVREKNGMTEVVVTDKQGKTQTVSGDRLLVALGRTPNTEGLGLDAIGVDYDRRGVKVDRRMRTTQPHIFAAGDINGAFQFTHAAGYEGGIVISNAIFHLPRKTDYTFLPWCTYTDPELASIGMNEAMAKKAGITASVVTEHFNGNDRALAEDETTGVIKLVLNEKERPIGVQILGPHGGELISEWVGILNGGVKLATVAGAVHPYPTLAEINKKVAGSLFSRKLFSPKVKKLLRLFFGYQGQ